MTKKTTSTDVPETGRFHSVAEVARIMGVSERTVRRWLDQPNGLPKHQFGHLIRISHDDLLTYQFKHRG